MKKGASHVDWAIGTGIFVVFMILTITFLRPGTEPMYKGSVLMQIIEDNLKQDAYYEVEKQILVISPNENFVDCNECYIRIRNATDNGLNINWVNGSDPTGDMIRNIAIVNSTQNLPGVIFDAHNEYCESNPAPAGCEGYYPNPLPEGYKRFALDFNGSVVTEKNNTFYILHTPDFRYNTDESAGWDSKVPIDMIDNPSDVSDWCNDYICLLDGEYYNFSYNFGVAEKFIGFSEYKTWNLSQEGYDQIKERWNIPLDKNFNITIENLTEYMPYNMTNDFKNGFYISIGSNEPIPPQMNVFAREWNDWVLRPEAEIEPVRVTLTVW